MKNGIIPGFSYLVEVLDKDGNVTESGIEHNIIPGVGKDFIADLIVGSVGSATSTWFLGLIDTYTPVNATLMSDAVTNEITTYDEATREAWTWVYDGDNYLLTNTASKAEFTFAAEETIYGAFITSNSVKANSGGILLSMAAFSSPRTVSAGGILRVTATLAIASTN